MRYLVLSATVLLAVMIAAAQGSSPSAARPTYLDAFEARPIVKSPDGRLAVTVTGPKESYLAWLTIDPSASPGGPIQVWPIQRNGEALWRPDSNALAFTDNRYANLAYVLVFGTRFDMGESGAKLGLPVEDLTPIVRKTFDSRAQEYYARSDYDSRLFYAKALRWVGDDRLLVGVNAKTVGPASFPNRGIKDWYVAYLIDVSGKRVLRELDEGRMLSEYGIDLDKQNW